MNLKLVYAVVYSAGKAFAELAKRPKEGTAGARLVEQAHAAGVLGDKDRRFYQDNHHRWYYDPKFSDAQRRYRENLNAKILGSAALQQRWPCLRAGAAVGVARVGAAAAVFGTVVAFAPPDAWEVELPGGRQTVRDEQLRLATEPPPTPERKRPADDPGSSAKQPKTEERKYLDCPFAEKDEAKSLGAKFDNEKRKWYVAADADLAPFAKWMPASDRYLDCPFDEKDEAKALGAKWDNEQRKWYVPAGRSLAPFAKWMPGPA